MIRITVEHMQGEADGNHCLKVIEDDGTRFGKTLGFVVPLQYNFEGYWGGTAYFVCSFNHPEGKRTEETFQTIWDVAIHLGVDLEEFVNALPRKEGEPYFHQWEYMNTSFAHDLWWK